MNEKKGREAKGHEKKRAVRVKEERRKRRVKGKSKEKREEREEITIELVAKNRLR